MRSRKFLKAEQAPLVWDAPGLMAGVDEAGRGPLAGPVVAAAVILDDLRPIRGLADSKTLTALQRERLHDQILAKALCCSIAQASVEEIDSLNILQATMLAMRRAVEGLRLKPVKVLVDGNRLPRLDVLAEAIVKGDARVKAISAASILAKVHRDRLCTQLHDEFPNYGFAGHKGYGTREHLEALQRHGACVHHRRSFSPVAAALARTAAATSGVTVVTGEVPATLVIGAAENQSARLDPRAAP
ncbi:ribonuclease HII [Variovorax boronicumulans]|uniref:ribonuclease HII n=1 Tax=Variovorax boronicumulans TaxID=436515 RepID=UPI0033950699